VGCASSIYTIGQCDVVGKRFTCSLDEAWSMPIELVKTVALRLKNTLEWCARVSSENHRIADEELAVIGAIAVKL
jgi:hypothetical protein